MFCCPQDPPRDAGLRIDHLLLSKEAAPRLLAAGVDRNVRGEENGSDHAPVWIELRDAPRATRKMLRAKPSSLPAKWEGGGRRSRLSPHVYRTDVGHHQLLRY